MENFDRKDTPQVNNVTDTGTGYPDTLDIVSGRRRTQSARPNAAGASASTRESGVQHNAAPSAAHPQNVNNAQNMPRNPSAGSAQNDLRAQNAASAPSAAHPQNANNAQSMPRNPSAGSAQNGLRAQNATSAPSAARPQNVNNAQSMPRNPSAGSAQNGLLAQNAASAPSAARPQNVNNAQSMPRNPSAGSAQNGLRAQNAASAPSAACPQNVNNAQNGIAPANRPQNASPKPSAGSEPAHAPRRAVRFAPAAVPAPSEAPRRQAVRAASGNAASNGAPGSGSAPASANPRRPAIPQENSSARSSANRANAPHSDNRRGDIRRENASGAYMPANASAGTHSENISRGTLSDPSAPVSRSRLPAVRAVHSPAQAETRGNAIRPNAQKAAPSNGLTPRHRSEPVRSHSERVYKYGAADETPKESNTTLTSLLKAVVYIMFILIVSGFLSYFGITAGNDVFALVKDDTVIEVTIPELTTTEELAELLAEKGVIRYPSIFRIYSKLRKDDGAYIAGDYTVSPSMNYDKLIATFKYKESEVYEVRVTIPEGYTVDDIITLFTEGYGISTREDFVDVIQNGEFDYWFIKDLDGNVTSDRKYRLEGYLYPDTYNFYSNSSAKTVINKLLYNFSVRCNDFLSRYAEKAGQSVEVFFKTKCDELGMTVDEVVTLASMVQMEARDDSEYGEISSVFHNRLNNTSVTSGKLESDATIQYILTERHEELTVGDLAIDSRYNTYMYSGLPPGPITNVTFVAINYALFPENTGYYYFVAQPNGYSLFAKTYAEHLRNIQIVEAQKAALAG